MDKQLTKPLTVRLLSIDPGFNFMGICISELDFHSLTQRVIHVETINFNRYVKRFKHSPKQQGSKALMDTHMVKQLLAEVLHVHQPDVVVCEATYMGRFVNAFAALTLCINAIETAAYRYDDCISFYTFEPSSVKKAMGVKGGSKEKEDMREALAVREDISLGVPIDQLDEHSVDAICIGQCYFKTVLGI